nr:WRKY41 [Persea americana]
MSSNPPQSPFSLNLPSYGFPTHNQDHPSFQLSDYLIDDCSDESVTPAVTSSSPNPMFENFHYANQFSSTDPGSSSMQVISTDYGVMKKIKLESGFRIAFRTKSELENLDDGFKWRKYGKKTVKNSPNPRNYYRCSNGGCSVKKRIERDREDRNYVITTYEGVHNHESPSVIYCAPHQNLTVTSSDTSPLEVPQTWSLQQPAYSQV